MRYRAGGWGFFAALAAAGINERMRLGDRVQVLDKATTNVAPGETPKPLEEPMSRQQRRKAERQARKAKRKPAG